jgi:hypothetical protein
MKKNSCVIHNIKIKKKTNQKQQKVKPDSESKRIVINKTIYILLYENENVVFVN